MVRIREMRAVPRLAYALIAINVIVFIAEGSGVFTLGGGASSKLITKGGLIGSSEIPQLAGQGVAHGELWRIVTSGFLHENLFHIGFNMWVLYYLGDDAGAGARLAEAGVDLLRLAAVRLPRRAAGLPARAHRRAPRARSSGSWARPRWRCARVRSR